MRSVTETLTTHYDACLSRHGPTPEGMDWGPDATRLTERFDTIVRAAGLGPRSTCHVLDVGCGCGLLLDHLNERGIRDVTYTGVDASAAMIDAAGLRHPNADWRRQDILDPAAEPTADWVVANGLLTERRDVDEETMEEFARDALARMYLRCRTGIVFNALSTHVNYREPHLFYWDPGVVIAFATKTLSRHVAILHDQRGYDYFCRVTRRPWGDRGDG
ncbi:MAG: class I SAM-dependent methyltransferase [Phycisphaerales bacterium]|nr:class I SAM-dependent methyltransferase [Phycisphaerae bacterium]NNF44860.1 class I SAM-dependent methyltransferase [Phycisphaerales bacterium]NNM25215.1 class I SAM-dependent methyltransferase [Phycisphaerales bacterium]